MASYKISSGQLRAIHALGRTLGMDRDDLHGIGYRISGQESLKQLTRYEARYMIDELKARAGQKPGIPPIGGSNRATPAQQRMIYHLEQELGWFNNPVRMRSWLKRMFGIEEERFLTVAQASRAIDGLKAILAGGRAEREGY